VEGLLALGWNRSIEGVLEELTMEVVASMSVAFFHPDARAAWG